jgi:hypothetical protein
MAATALALMLSACTREYSKGTTATTDGILRPGTPPMGVGAHPGGPPVDAPDQITDPNAPKESNGGSGTDTNVLRGGTAETSAVNTGQSR